MNKINNFIFNIALNILEMSLNIVNRTKSAEGDFLVCKKAKEGRFILVENAVDVDLGL